MINKKLVRKQDMKTGSFIAKIIIFNYYIQSIKPVTTQFAVGRNRTAQVVRKQFPLRLAAAKTVHRSQGDTQTEIVLNLNTRRGIPHIHYFALSRVTTIEGLYVTDLVKTKFLLILKL